MKINIIFIIFIIGLVLSTSISTIPVYSQKNVSESLRIVLKQPLYSVGADGSEYPLYIEVQDSEGRPVELNNDIIIKLFSSDIRVAEPPSEVKLRAGSHYVITYFKTSETPGSAVITAMAPGFQSGNILIKTEYSVGYPKKLAVYVYPDTLLPTSSEEANVVVVLQDVLGKPARAPENIRVTLYSSNILVGDVTPNEITIQTGETYAIAKFRPTTIAGTTIITASASGYESGRDIVTTIGPKPRRIMVVAAPAKLPSNGVDKSFVFITAYLVDENGYPARADKDIVLTFTSSNITLGYFKNTHVTLYAGDYTVQNKLYSNSEGLGGVIEVTVQAKGLEAGKAIIEVYPPAKGEGGNLRIYGAPPIFPPGESQYENAIVVQVENSSGYPIILTKDIKVYLSSSNTLYGDVYSDTITIDSGSSIGYIDFLTTKLVGTTVVTASANNFTSDHIEIETYAPPPVKLKLGVGPANIRATGDDYPFLYVQLQDESGRPTAAQESILVYLSSSNEAYGKVPENIVIRNGESFEYITFISTSHPGETNITASAEGYESDTILIKTIEPFPSILSATTYTTFIANGETYPIYIQLLDSMGRPAKPEIPVKISLRSSNPDVIDVTGTVFLASGAPYVFAEIQTSGYSGKATISIAAPGYEPTSITVNSITLPLNVSISADKSSIYANETLDITVYVNNKGIPVGDASLILSAENGYITSSGKTRIDGSFTATYIPSKPGEDTIRVYASKPGYEPAYAEFKLYVDKLINIQVLVQTKDGRGIEGINVTVTGGDDRIKSILTDSTGKALIKYVKWGNISITVGDEITRDKVRYIFLGWSDGQSNYTWSGYLDEDTELTALYKVQYFITVSTSYSTAYGSGWYDKGSSISIGIEETSIPVNWVVSKKFNAWTGDVYSKDPQTSFVVDSPKVITAEWVDDYTNLYYLIAAIVIAVGVIVGITIYFKKFRRKPPEEEERIEALEEWAEEKPVEEEVKEEEEKEAELIEESGEESEEGEEEE